MDRNELNVSIEELMDLEAQIEELTDKANEIKSALKEILVAEDVEFVETDKYIIRWTSYESNKFDTTAFKKEHKDLYEQFTKVNSSRRFSIGNRKDK